MKFLKRQLLFITLFLMLTACAARASQPALDQDSGSLINYNEEQALSALRKGGCGSCHVIPRVPGAVGMIGPDLSTIGQLAEQRIESGDYSGLAKTAREYILESLQSPDAFIPPDCPAGPCPKGVMSTSQIKTLNSQELDAVVNFLLALPGPSFSVLENEGK